MIDSSWYDSAKTCASATTCLTQPAFDMQRGSSSRLCPIQYQKTVASDIRSTSFSTTESHPSKSLSSNLAAKLLGDVWVSSLVTFGIAPFISVIDKAIVERYSGNRSIFQSSIDTFRYMFRNPVAYAKSPAFLIVWGVYVSTYSTANCLKTLFEHYENFDTFPTSSRQDKAIQLSYCDSKQSSAVPSIAPSSDKTAILFLTTAINTTATILKDKYYTTTFGASKILQSAKVVPPITYGLWCLRDSIIIGSTFILPDLVAEYYADMKSCIDSSNIDFSRKFLQVACPLSVPLVIGPIHALSIDYYNRPLHGLPTSEVFRERFRLLKANYWSVVSARMCRVSIGFALGALGTTYLRDEWRQMLWQNESKRISNESTACNHPEWQENMDIKRQCMI